MALSACRAAAHGAAGACASNASSSSASSVSVPLRLQRQQQQQLPPRPLLLLPPPLPPVQQQQPAPPPRCRCRCAAAPGSGGGPQQRPRQPGSGPPDPLAGRVSDMEDVFIIPDGEEEEDEAAAAAAAAAAADDGDLEWDFDADEEEEEEDGFLSDDEADEDEQGGLLGAGSDDDPGPEVLTGNVAWGDTALAVAQRVLQQPENAQLALYLFRVLVPTKTIEVRLDKLDDLYGSPQLDDIERFSRQLLQGLEAELGPEAAGEIGLEVSSPGAERTLIVPHDLLRFQGLPMRVEYMNGVGQLTSLVLQFNDMDEAEGMTSWTLADVKANQSVKGRGLSKRQRAQCYDIPFASLERVRIHIDF